MLFTKHLFNRQTELAFENNTNSLNFNYLFKFTMILYKYHLLGISKSIINF